MLTVSMKIFIKCYIWAICITHTLLMILTTTQRCVIICILQMRKFRLRKIEQTSLLRNKAWNRAQVYLPPTPEIFWLGCSSDPPPDSISISKESTSVLYKQHIHFPIRSVPDILARSLQIPYSLYHCLPHLYTVEGRIRKEELKLGKSGSKQFLNLSTVLFI